MIDRMRRTTTTPSTATGASKPSSLPRDLMPLQVELKSAKGGADMPSADAVGRPARVTTLNCRPTSDLSALIRQAENAIRGDASDLVVLPESCRGQAPGRVTMSRVRR